ncbi:TPA_asm: N [Rubus alphacytorhabdovirus 1]|nr:TPA_asm: N [Rubus alphacytorhabdovirus 1]
MTSSASEPDLAARLKTLKGLLDQGSSSSSQPPIYVQKNPPLKDKQVQINKPNNSKSPLKNQKLTERYRDLSKVSISLKNSPKVWKDDHLSSIEIVEVKQLTATDAIAIGKSVFSHIEDNSYLSSHLDDLLALAVSLFSPGYSGTRMKSMLTDIKGHAGKPIAIASTDSGSGVQETKAKENKVLASLERTLKSTTDLNVIENLKKAIEKIKAEGEVPQEDSDEVDVNEAFAYTFMAAYCMRLYCKTAANWVDKMDAAKKRFKGWYNCSSDFMDKFSMNEVDASSLRDALTRRPEWCSTWVLWVAHAESTSSFGKNEKGMLRYLATLPFSYTAMHAYPNIIEIHTLTGVTFDKILAQLDCPITRAGCTEVANIMRNHEIMEGSDRTSTYFRYARVWDPGYFHKLQTSSCQVLAYVTAACKKMLSTNANSDPTDIYALRGMDPAQKATLDAVAERLYNYLMDLATNDGESGQIWARG